MPETGYRNITIKNQEFRLDKGIPFVKTLPKDTDKAKARIESVIAKTKTLPMLGWGPNIAVHESQLSDAKVKALGFQPTRLYTRFPGESLSDVSYRSGRLHAHKIGPVFVIHKDKYEVKGLDAIKHVIEEGIPSLFKIRSTNPPPVILGKSKSATLLAFADEINKIAETIKTNPTQLTTTLLPHQQRVVDRIKNQPGLVVAHGTGSGKTLSSIAAAVKLSPKKVKVVVPAALVTNYEKELKKHTKDGLPVEVVSLQGSANKGELDKADLLIVDEAHRIRNTGTKTHSMIVPQNFNKRLLLTASPMYNKPEDVAPLINMAAGQKVLPEGRDFEKMFVHKPDPNSLAALMPWSDPNPRIIRKETLRPVLSKWVDYHKGQEENFPTKKEFRIDVPMNSDQTDLHNLAWGKLPFFTRWRMEKGLPPNKQDLKHLNAFESQSRQISTTLAPYTQGNVAAPTPKITKAFSNFVAQSANNPNHKGIVYSNYINALNDYSKLLTSKGIPHAVFTGKQSRKERDRIRDAYNSGELKAILLSSAGGEGLDLKGTRQVQILEPHWNPEKINQVVGRAVRYKSHEHLSEPERNVQVEHYVSYPKTWYGGKGSSVETYLSNLSQQKENLSKQMLDLIQSDKR
jgi:superfamily II DNA or RNA helicase